MEFTTRFELQSQATRLFECGPNLMHNQPWTGLSPSIAPSSKGLEPVAQGAAPLQTTIRPKAIPTVGIFPLHSPLLGESWLVSFPPLSYMLKFSGSSCLSGGPVREMLTMSPRCKNGGGASRFC
jgi:hypothetical protein